MTKMERIIKMLKALEYPQAARDLAEGWARIIFGDATVYVSEKSGGAVLDVGVDWPGMGIVGVEAAWIMALDLQHATGLADMVQHIIDSEEEEQDV